ncbi:MAG TPA: cytochrome b N-terminal domain-containing protein [Candidatus Paceibacterota bacterium]|nr:cytochrome b N-terminal domain-containing protein [Candidatus Paceibacterota bacterium]
MNEEPREYDAHTNAFQTLKDKIYFHRLPSYGNSIFYSLGFMALTCLLLLAGTGIIMAFMGQTWWLFSSEGIFVRSVHLWTVQAFIFILVLHVLVGFSTSGFRAPRRMVWVFGAIIFALVLIQTEFGYGLRGDFSSQFRAVSGADFWNGAYLGYWLNPLNYTQTFVIHVAIIPLTIFFLFLGHYILEHTYGIARPFRKETKYKMVAADHRKLFMRGGALVALIFSLAFFFHSPYVPSVTIADIAKQNPALVAQTLLEEFNHTSDTATYFDSIDPYTFDTQQVYVVVPFQQYALGAQSGDSWAAFTSEPLTVQKADIEEAKQYVTASDTNTSATTTNPVIHILRTLLPMAKSGLYESLLNQENPTANNTYTLRFLVDMGIPEAKAASLNMATLQWGMTKDETGSVWKLPPGSWWLLPLALVNTAFNLPNNLYGDRDAGFILGFLLLVFILFPYIPYLNQLPELLPFGRIIQKEPKEKEPPMEHEK